MEFDIWAFFENLSRVDAKGFWRYKGEGLGGWGVINLISWVPLNEVISTPPPYLLFTRRRKQNPLSKRSNFNLLVFVFTSDDGKVHKLNNLSRDLSSIEIWQE